MTSCDTLARKSLAAGVRPKFKPQDRLTAMTAYQQGLGLSQLPPKPRTAPRKPGSAPSKWRRIGGRARLGREREPGVWVAQDWPGAAGMIAAQIGQPRPDAKLPTVVAEERSG